MTAQISDTVRYLGKDCSLAGINGTGLFDPADVGVVAYGWSSACWRGFYCGYEVAEGSLLLSQVHLGLGTDDRAAVEQGGGPKLFGRTPRRYTIHGHSEELFTGEVKTSWESSDYRVDGLREFIPFTGGLLVGDDFIRELYVHMGFHPAYKFREVHELIFDAGRLTEEYDRSDAMAEFRAIYASRSPGLKSGATKDEISRWVEQCFSRSYGRFGG
jgi:hypothetical protein